MAKKKKREALTVSRLITEVLVAQLSIPFRQIVNDTTFQKYTGSKRPDLLISEFEFYGENEEAKKVRDALISVILRDKVLVDGKLVKPPPTIKPMPMSPMIPGNWGYTESVTRYDPLPIRMDELAKAALGEGE